MAKAHDLTASERAYAQIKHSLLSGALRFRQRLDPVELAQVVGASTTPVREALIRLTSERLVLLRPAHGFSVALWSEAQLRALYLWRGALTRLALESGGRAAAASAQPTSAYPDSVAEVLAVGADKINSELERASANADDRLYRARSAEADLWADAREDLDALAKALNDAAIDEALRALNAYHSKRAGAAAAIRARAVLLDLPSNGA